MGIQPTGFNPNLQTQFKTDQKPAKGTEQKANQTQKIDQYIPSEQEQKVTYDKPEKNANLIEQLQAQSEQRYHDLIQTIQQLLKKQGITLDLALSGKVDVKVDEATRTEAKEAIGEGGFYSPEKVSDRILEFAKTLSGGDMSKFETLKQAVKDGFEAARGALGGTLPDISNQTYDLVMEKLDAWKAEATSAE